MSETYTASWVLIRWSVLLFTINMLERIWFFVILKELDVPDGFIRMISDLFF